jgi:hypothetical protein
VSRESSGAADVQARWRAGRNLDRRDAARPARARARGTMSRSSTVTTDHDRRIARHPQRASPRTCRARRCNRRCRLLATAELVGCGGAVLGDLAGGRDREPDHTELCAPTRVGSSLANKGALARRARANSAAPTTRASRATRVRQASCLISATTIHHAAPFPMLDPSSTIPRSSSGRPARLRIRKA